MEINLGSIYVILLADKSGLLRNGNGNIVAYWDFAEADRIICSGEKIVRISELPPQFKEEVDMQFLSEKTIPEPILAYHSDKIVFYDNTHPRKAILPEKYSIEKFRTLKEAYDSMEERGFTYVIPSDYDGVIVQMWDEIEDIYFLWGGSSREFSQVVQLIMYRKSCSKEQLSRATKFDIDYLDKVFEGRYNISKFDHDYILKTLNNWECTTT